MKTKKRFFTLMLALALAVCMAVPAFASNEDSNFMIPIASNYTWGANEVSVRKKDQRDLWYLIISARCGGNLWAEGLCPSGCV